MRAAAGLPLLGAAGVLVTVSLLFGGSSGDERLFWIGAGALAVAFAAAAASLAGLLPRPSPTGLGLAALALLAAFTAWNGVTIWWSIAGDRSWDYLNRGLVYCALAIVGLYVGALVPRPARTAAAVLAVLLAAVLGWALLGKVFPGLFPDGARVARLRNPVGYWNALALLAAIALPIYLWLAARRRVLGPLGLYLALVALLLTYSRGGVLVAVLAACAWIALGIGRRESLAALAVSVPPALGVAGIAFALSGVTDDLEPRGVREADGGWFGLAFLAGAAVVAFLARRDLRRPELRVLSAAAAVLVAVGIAALAARGGWLEQFRGSDGAQVTQTGGRLVSASSNNRWTWWQEAWEVFEREPAGGKGAGTFEIARRPQRKGSLVTSEPHNVALQFLAETGIAGFLLGAAAAVASLLAAAQAVRRTVGEERAAALALALALPVYLVHALADIDWDFVAVSAPVFLLLGVLLGGVAPARPSPRRPVLAVAAVLLGFAALYSMTAPWLADRRVEDAYDAIARNDLAAALDAANEAHDLDPLSPEPFWAAALAHAANRDVAEALADYERATELQPENSSTWYALGAYEFRVGRYLPAYRHLDRAYGLDIYGPAGIRGGLLDQARAKVPPGDR